MPNFKSSYFKPIHFNTKILNKSVLAIMLATGAFANCAVANANYSSVTFFGDSLTDGGYFSPITQGKLGIRDSGQFTTNPDSTWADSFAKQLGTTSVANNLTGKTDGNNYAIGGARAGEDIVNTNFGASIPIASALSQAKGYLANHQVDANGLYVVWSGANDLLAAAKDQSNAQKIILSAIDSEVATIKALADNGANYILVPNIPDIGLTPDAIDSGTQALSTHTSNLYNTTLINKIKSTDANVIPLDTFSLLQEIAKTPDTYGFTNITDRACVGASSLLCGKNNLVTENADKTYLFADGVHPAGKTHQMIADYAHSVVTAPSQIGILPHLATTSGLATSERLQSHIHQIQNLTKHSTTSAKDSHMTARNLWATADISNQDIAGYDGDKNNNVLVGLDLVHANKSQAATGIYANISQNEYDSQHKNSGLGQVDLNEVGMGLYHTTTIDKLGGLQLNGAVGIGFLDIETNRQVTLGNVTKTHSADTDGKRYYANVQAGYPMQFNKTAVTPYLGASVNRVRINEILEDSDSATAMQFSDQTYTTTYGKVGVYANSHLTDKFGVFGDVSYQAQLSDDNSDVTARLNSLKDLSFNTPTSKTDDDRLAMTLGVSGNVGKIKAQAGVTHTQGDDDDATSIFVGLSSSF